MKKLAVIILNWNGIDLLRKFIPAAMEFTSGKADLYVADNGSEDDSLEWLSKEYPDAGIIRLGKNYGFAEGYNRAIEEVRTPEGTPYPYVLLLNSDVEVTEGWWQPLVALLDADPSVGAAQPKIKSFKDKSMFEYAGAAGGYLDRLGYPYCRGRLFDSIEKDSGQYDGPPSDICWASGAALIVRTELYKRLGGLDSRFFAHMEEIDLCWRLRAMGYKLKVVTGSCVYHLGGGSLPAENPKKTYLNFRNSLLMLYKNLPAGQRKKMLFKRRLLDTLAWGMYVAKFDLANARAIFRAHRDYVKISKTYADSPAPKIPLPERRNIIVDYYIKGRKTYNLL